jgi:hypothetical protein
MVTDDRDSEHYESKDIVSLPLKKLLPEFTLKRTSTLVDIYRYVSGIIDDRVVLSLSFMQKLNYVQTQLTGDEIIMEFKQCKKSVFDLNSYSFICDSKTQEEYFVLEKKIKHTFKPLNF